MANSGVRAAPWGDDGERAPLSAGFRIEYFGCLMELHMGGQYCMKYLQTFAIAPKNG